MSHMERKGLQAYKPVTGWTWQAVEEIILTGMRAVQLVPDKEQKFIKAGDKINWPQIRRDRSDYISALQGAKTADERIQAMRGRFTIDGYRQGVTQEAIDLIDPAFDLLRMIDHNNRDFFRAVLLYKLFSGNQNVNWGLIKSNLGYHRQVKPDSLGTRYRRILMRIAEAL